jgi:sulfate permease, SulP family
MARTAADLLGRASMLRRDAVAGLTLAAYAVPVGLAYATLAGLAPQAGIYGYLFGGLAYALAGSSRFLAIGPTSAISLMIAGTVGGLAGGDAVRYGELAAATALLVGLICLLAWVLRLSTLIKLISDSVLTGFKAGAAASIGLTQVPGLLGVPGGGGNVPERLWLLLGQLPQTHLPTLLLGLAALALLLAGEKWLPGRPVALAVVVLGIAVTGAFGLARAGIAVTGAIPSGLPLPHLPDVRWRDQDGIVALATGCMLLAYIEGVAAARAFAASAGGAVDPRRELLGLSAANVAAALFGGYPVAGGLSQTAVNQRAGATSRLSLVFAAVTLGLGLLFLTDLLANLPKAVLAAIVLVAVRGLIDVPALRHMARVSRIDFYSALAALIGVMLLGILQGIVLAALISVMLMIRQYSAPHVAFLGRIPDTGHYSDMERHPENTPVAGAVLFRPEASVTYLNAEAIMAAVLRRFDAGAPAPVRLVLCDLSASPMLDLAGAKMLDDLEAALAGRGAALSVIGAIGRVRDLLRAEGLDARVGGIERGTSIAAELERLNAAG